MISRHKFAFSLVLLGILSGCDSSDPNGAFNLASIRAVDSRNEDGSGMIKQMKLTWNSASDDLSGSINYSVCQYDPSQTNNCNVLSTVTDQLSDTVAVPSLLGISDDYFILAASGGNSVLSDQENLSASTIAEMIGYIKASNSDTDDQFGSAVALSEDGNILAIGAPEEDGDEANSGAVYLFAKSEGIWRQTAYLKASIPVKDDAFGSAVALSKDGTILAIGAPFENGSESNSGAVYLFTESEGNWSQTEYLKANQPGFDDNFGSSVALSDQGSILAIGAPFEDADESNSGAVYLFTADQNWAQTDYVKASSPGDDDNFGRVVALSENNSTLAVGAPNEDTDESNSGAVYLFTKTDNSWSQVDYIKAQQPNSSDNFGSALALSEDASVLAVGAPNEDSELANSGAAYLFTELDESWSQSAYIKASNVGYEDQFGSSVSLNADATILAVSAVGEDSAATSVNGEQNNNAESSAGAVYVFAGDQWDQTAYIKASNTGEDDNFGRAISLSADGSTLAVGASDEDSGSTGVNGDDNGDASNSGALYLY